MNSTIDNYDGSITTSPQQIAYPKTVSDLQSILKSVERYPSPVRAVGSYHSLTPCGSSDGTIVKMSEMNRVVNIDPTTMTITAEAGLQVIDAAQILRSKNLQFMTNIEIGNMTLGASACCHTKDGLDGFPLGQFSSHVTEIKWVDPHGELRHADASTPDVLRRIRSSYGLCGIIYEVTFRIKPLEAVQFAYTPRHISRLSQRDVDRIINDSEGLVCWTVGKIANFQTRSQVEKVGPLGSWFAARRRRMWNHTAASVGRSIDRKLPTRLLRNATITGWFAVIELMYYVLHFSGGHSLADPDKIIDYRSTPISAKYAFTFWAFPRDQWLSLLKEYLDFSDKHYKKYGFRCNMPLGSYYVRKDASSLLSYTYDGDIFSIDPIHACSDRVGWNTFLQEFNEFASKRHGIPLLNQTPFVTRRHVQDGYGQRWQEFSDWVKQEDPSGRMLNFFFKALL
jgi:hypothetical protein